MGYERMPSKEITDRYHIKKFNKIVIFLFLSAIVYVISAGSYNFLLFHNIFELYCIVLSGSLFIITWNTRDMHSNNYFLLLGTAYGFIAIFLALHLLNYEGMGLGGGDYFNLSIQFRIAAAYAESLSLLLLSFIFCRDSGLKHIQLKSIIIMYSIAAAVLFLLIFNLNIFPDCYIPGKGFTLFKTISQSIVTMLLLTALFHIIKGRRKYSSTMFTFFLLSISSSIAAESIFAFGVNPICNLSMISHIFKSISLYFMYKAVTTADIIIPYSIAVNMNNELEIKSSKLKEMYDELACENMERKKTEEELHLQKMLFQQLFENSPQGIVILDNSNMILDVNAGFGKIFGYQAEEMKGSFLSKLIVPPSMQKEMTEFMGSIQKDQVIQIESKRLKKDGKEVDVSILGYPIKIDGRLSGSFRIYNDITERKKLEDEIKYLSFHDKLTGLYNRAFFDEEFKRLDTERQLPLGIIMGDLNNLKITNDTFGHAEGDKLLIKIAEILKCCCREEDVIARWGGDEFIILLPKTSIKTSLEVCSRISNACMKTTDTVIEPSIALGCAAKEDKDEDLHDTLGQAERRMYKDKLAQHVSIKRVIQTTRDKSQRSKDHKTLTSYTKYHEKQGD